MDDLRSVNKKGNMSTKKAILVILDGWGLGEIPEVDAIKQGETPYFDHLVNTYPTASLVTYGEEVGLPQGQMGNSEVGHLNIGAGRIVYQELARINKEIREGLLSQNETLVAALKHAKDKQKDVHLMGLLSDGGVHSHINHLKALIDVTEDVDLPNTFIHAFLDGRDTAPDGGQEYLKDLLEHIEGKQTQLSTIVGRYFAMDRDQRWERTKKAYDLLVHGKADINSKDILTTVQEEYKKEITDEFMSAIKVNTSNPEGQLIKDGDVVICFNFRTDRPRQISQVLTQMDLPDYRMEKLNLHYVTMTSYDQSYKNVHVLYRKDNIEMTLGAVIEQHKLTQVRIAETEKYPHVTFFFNGGREAPFEGEDRIMIPSPKVATYDLAPEMSAREVTSAICARISGDQPDFICLNYANADMVGHTGDFKAAQEACKVVDTSLRELLEEALKNDYECIVIADHGNSDIMINPDGSKHTAHTTNLVPIVYVSKHPDQAEINDGKLADVAPTILGLMGVPQDDLMTGENLVLRKK